MTEQVQIGNQASVLSMWNALRQRFGKMVEDLTEEQLDWVLGDTTIRFLLHHTAEVEFLFADWFLGKKQPAQLPPFSTRTELLALLRASDQHVKDAIHALPEEKWTEPVESRMGASTPLEAIGRLMYHAGIHAGQIALIKKQYSTGA
ncbi:DinB family protein [Sporosarcina sp. Te-1]|uniref:DinB family protein n=1 Tax=Sporosarcina sp. Te-1 TaxID=2818390 RepID=UPI001A9D5A3E|nr:DinB family protein [Sporosarcina sp. Te-1]QTD43187.1 DinB family protein [Sporosarcina sp. Te-1]